jgi:hypothetical protein
MSERAETDIPVWSSTTWPGGIKRWKSTSSDEYTGPREALIASGLAQAQWFPDAPVRDARGRLRRKFSFKCEHGEIVVTDRRNGRWSVDLPVAAPERERRRKEWLQQRSREDQLRKQAPRRLSGN